MRFAKNTIRACLPRRIRNWLRSPPASVRWAWDELKYALGAKPSVHLRPGWTLVYHPAAYRLAYMAQNTDPEQISEFDGFITKCWPGMVLFDLGAHFGLFSLAALHYGGSTAKAIAVDPSPAAARMLRIQGRLNGAGQRLVVVEASVADRNGWQDLVAAGIQGAGYFVPPSQDHCRSELTRTRSMTLDALAHKFQTQPTHIKIDVEGYEAAVLRGGQRVLSQPDAPLLFLELHNQLVCERNGDPEQVLGLLNDFGYGIFAPDATPIDRASILSRPLIRIMAAKAVGKASMFTHNAYVDSNPWPA